MQEPLANLEREDRSLTTVVPPTPQQIRKQAPLHQMKLLLPMPLCERRRP